MLQCYVCWKHGFIVPSISYNVCREIVTIVLTCLPVEYHFCSLMGLGGWSILNVWLSESKKAQNVALLIQLMQVGELPYGGIM